MKAQMLTLVVAVGLLGIGNQDEPGWLSKALASTDPDVEAAIEAYEAGELDTATERLDAAVARRGERAELYYDRGLLLLAQGDQDGARAAFEHGTESSEVQVRASSHYELGNLGMAAEDWQAAIDAYIECLRAQPGHENAKWNLELALQRKREQEEKDKQEQEQEEQDKQDKQDQEDGEQDKEQEPGEDGEQDKEPGEDGEQDKQEPKEPDQEPGEDGEQDQKEQDQKEQDQQQPEPKPGEQQEAQPQPIESGDLDSALDELDRQDAFMFGRPRGSKREVEKDW